MEKLTIFYDGACHLCAREIDHYKKVDTTHKILYLDIAKESFNFSDYDIDKKQMQKYFHIRDKDLKMHTGVDAFYLIWKELEIFSLLQKLYENPLMKTSMKLGYKVFAEIRPYLPKRKQCSDGICYR